MEHRGTQSANVRPHTDVQVGKGLSWRDALVVLRGVVLVSCAVLRASAGRKNLVGLMAINPKARACSVVLKTTQ